MMSWIWLAVFVAAVIIEAITIDLVSIWTAIASLIVLFISFLNIQEIYQILIFFILNIALLLFTRPLLKKHLKPRITPTNVDRLISKKAIVTKKIQPFEFGEVKIFGTIWSAVANEENEVINEKEEVKIIRVSGSKLIVSKIK